METRNTIQKSIIYDVFKQFTNHPTVDMIYEKVHIEYPTISKATVYRVLNQLSEEGKIQRVHVLGAADRYDFNLSKHFHILCKYCNMVYDIDYPGIIEIKDVDRKMNGFDIESIELCFVGKCPNCQKKGKEN